MQDSPDRRPPGGRGATAGKRPPDAGRRDDGETVWPGWRTGRRLITLAVLALAALAAVWWWAGRGTEVRTIRVAKGDAAMVVYATGIVEPVHWAKVSALQRKVIVDICRCEGEPVKAGQILARLDDGAERAVLTELEARLTRLKDDAERLARLVERNVTARTTYDEKLTQVREQESRVMAQKDRIADLALKSPMDGIVLRRDGEVGEIAGTGSNDVLLWVGDPTPLRVVAEVNEEDIFRVRAGQKALLRHEGSTSAPLPATVASITPKGDPQTKTFRVFLALPEDTPLRIGMSVEANIVVDEAKGVLLAPAEALANGDTLQVVADGRVRRRKVEVGIRGTRMVEIRQGIEEGALLVSPFQASLADGARIREAASGR